MGSTTPRVQKPWVETPCIRSTALSNEAGCNIYMKLENLQPSRSFKSRGIGNMMSKAMAAHGLDKPIRFYCSSGGNAGLACVTAAIALNCPATIVVPMSTSQMMVDKMKALGADVRQVGAAWADADRFLREELLGTDKNGFYVPPFDHPDVWEGHGSMVAELERQMEDEGGYDAIVCSVGGGGLLCGIMQSLEKYGHLEAGHSNRVKALAVETNGADSLNQSIQKGELIRLPAITSIATTLGAAQVAQQAFKYGMRKDVTSIVLGDAEAAMACVEFANDERILVESSCGVSVATAYNGSLHKLLFPELSEAEFRSKNIVIVVCGGSNISLDILKQYQDTYGDDEAVRTKFHQRRNKTKNVVPAAGRLP